MASLFRKYIQKFIEPFHLAKSIYSVNVAGFYLSFGKTEKALKLNEVAHNTLAKKKGWRITSARCEKNLAEAYYLLGNYEKAIERFRTAREKFDRKNKQIYVALCESNMAHAYFSLDNYKEALDLFLSARNIFENADQKEYVADLDRVIATVYSSLGQTQKAIQLNRSARLVLSKKTYWEIETARCDVDLAAIHSNIGQHEKAIELYLTARKIFEKAGTQLDVAKCDMNMALGCMALGQNKIASNLLKSSLKVFRHLDEKVAIGDCEHNLGKVYFEFYQYDKSLQLLQSARKIFDNGGIHGKAAICDIETAKIYSNLGQYEKALELNQSARKVLENNEGNRLKSDETFNGIASCDFNMANIYHRLGQYEKALEQYESIRDDLKRRGLVDEINYCDLNKACMYSFLNQHEKALTLFQSVRKAYDKKGLKTDVDRCDLNMAAIHMLSGDLKSAFNLFQKVNNSDDLNLKAKSLFGIGNLHWKQGNIKQAKFYCAAAIEEVENIRESIQQDDLRTSFLGTVYDFYYIMVDICLKNNDFKGAFKYVERLKSRCLAEMLANRDLLPRNATRDEKLEFKQLRSNIRIYSNQLSTMKDPKKVLILSKDMEQLEKKHEEMVAYFRTKDSNFDPDHKITVSHSTVKSLVTDSDSAIIELFPMDDKLVVFIIKNGQDIDDSSEIIDDYNRFKLNSLITKLLERYTTYQECSGSKKLKAKEAWEDYLETILEELYHKLFLRIQPRIANINKITFIPYAGLHFLPLHAMFFKNNGRKHYVIDDYLVTYAPSAKVLKLCTERIRNNQGKIVLAHSNPKMNNSSLRFSQNEINSINDLFAGSKKINRATKSDIMDSGKMANILHYAGHAHSRALILHNEKNLDIMEEYWLEDIFENLYLPEAYLVTLSACETGMILPKGVDEHFGLSSGLMSAGAATVISSLWSVSDISTCLLMRKMYELINEGTGKAEALREAQLWLKNPDNRQEHNEMFKNYGKTEKLYNQNRGFAVQSVDWEEALPDDFHRPYHWGGFICSGVA